MMRLLTLASLLLLCTSLSLSAGISVVKYWSGVVTTTKDAKLACKASSSIKRCSWTNERKEMEFDSEMSFGRRDNEIVTIGRSSGSREDNMCFFTIDSVSMDHSGDWTCTVHGECEEEDFTEEYDENDDNFDGKKKRSIARSTQPIRSKRQTRNRSCKSGDCDEEACENSAHQIVKIDILDEDEIGAMGAQDEYYANMEDEVSLTVRTNEQFTKCKIRKGRDDIAEISGDARRDECVDMPGRRAGRVCAEVTRGVPSCILRINRMAADMEGVWTFTIQREVTAGRPRTLTKSADIELFMVELPTDVYLKYDGKEFRDDGENELNLKIGVATVQCIAEGGSPEPMMNLFVGMKNMTDEGRTCRGPGRDSKCVQFEVDVEPELNRETISCVAKMPDVDGGDGLGDSNGNKNKKLVSNGKQITLDINLGYPPQLVDPEDKQENTTITICDTQLCVGEDFDLVVQFDSNPSPSVTEWSIRNNDRRGKTVVKEGNRRRTYDAEYVESIKDRRNPDRFEARIKLEEIQAEDMSQNTEHLLKVTNDAGSTVFKFQFNPKRSCECDPDSSIESLDQQAPGDLKPLLTSCLALGSSLLENYQPDGSNRPSRQKEKEFENKVEDFFESATCAGYGREMFNNYKALTKQEPLATEIIFHKLDPTKNKIIHTKQDNVKTSKSIDVEIAQEIVSAAKKLNIIKDVSA